MRHYKAEGLIDKKNDRRMDDCIRYALVSGNKVWRRRLTASKPVLKAPLVSALAATI